MNANDLPRHLLIKLTADADVRLFRNNVGTGWAGRFLRRRPDGVVEVAGARALHAGLAVGSSDLIGWRSVEIEARHVGRRVAVFVGLEAKHGEAARLTPEQRSFIAAVKRAGGLAAEVRDVETALAALQF